MGDSMRHFGRNESPKEKRRMTGGGKELRKFQRPAGELMERNWSQGEGFNE